MEAATGDVSASDGHPERLNTRVAGLATQPVTPTSAMFLPRSRRRAVNSSAEMRRSLDLNMQPSDQPPVRELELDGR
jgi:hypothetical protein